MDKADSGAAVATCLESCRHGVCSECPTADVAIGPDLSWLYTQSVTLAAEHLVWDLAGERLSHRNLCTEVTTRIDCGSDACVYWHVTPKALLYTTEKGLRRWVDGVSLEASQARISGPFRVTDDGRVYHTGYWEDRLTLPGKMGVYFDGPHRKAGSAFITEDSTEDFVVDGVRAWYLDGKSIMRVGPDEKPERVFDAGAGTAPGPIAYANGTLFTITGDSLHVVDPTPRGPVSIQAIRDGKAETIFTTPLGASCFAASRNGAVLCLDSDLVFVDFSTRTSRVLFKIDPPRREGLGGRDLMTKVALSDDGGLAWSVPSDMPRFIHVRRPPRASACAAR